MPENVVLETDLEGLDLIHRGKVRDLYAVGDNMLLVATDRISAFDCVLPNGIPRKGDVLTAVTVFWLAYLERVVKSHFITAIPGQMGPAVKRHAKILENRCMLVRRAEVFPVECVVRGYLAGSGWKEYQESGTVCGIELPAGLREADRLPAPIFTPTTKAESGHDEPLTFEGAADLVGGDQAAALRDRSLEVYARAHEYARCCGIILADTKFEWGLADGEMILVDEVLTPDSSRFWPLRTYEPGRPQPSYDKQFVRDYLETLDWDKQPPAPELPDEVVHKTTEKYLQAYRELTSQLL